MKNKLVIEDTHEASSLLDVVFKPKSMLIMYESEGHPVPFLELRDIDDKGMPLAGRPVSRQFINDLIKSFSAEADETPCGPVPENLLYADNRPGQMKLIWYNPPRKRHLCFAADLQIPDGDYMMPGTIYETHGYDRLFIYAFTDDGRPTKDTVLYNMPMYNYYTDDHHLCLGSSKLDMETVRKAAGLSEGDFLTYDAVMKAWETLVWDSVNAHVGSEDTVKGILSNIIKDSKESFDNNCLVKTIYTLKSLYDGKQ